MRDVAVFVNPAARRGRGRARAASAIARLEASASCDVFEPASLDELHRQAATLVASGVGRIVVVGGDGIVHQVLQHVASTATVLGVVAVGTGNDFAGALGLPTDPEAAAVVALGPDRPIDLLRAGDRWAASVATVGFSAAVNERAERLRWPRGSARYSVATMIELPRLRGVELTYTLDNDTGSTTGRALVSLVAVGNTANFGGGMRICPEARPDDGLADVVLVHGTGRVRLLAHFGRVFRGTHVQHSAVSVHRARAVTLQAADGQTVKARADGEAWGELPLRIETVPGALHVAAPV